MLCELTTVPEFTEILTRYERPLLAFARQQCGDAETARDAVQDTFLALIRERPGGGLEELAPWLFTVCRRRLIDHHRKHHRLQSMDTLLTLSETPDESIPGPAAALEQKEDSTLLRRLVQRLPDRERELVRLKFEGGLSYQDIATATGLTVSNVGYLLHHAVQSLRSQFHALPHSL